MAYKIEPVIHSFDEMKRKWDRDNPDMPYERDAELSGWYDLDKWLLRVTDDGKVVGTIGWKEEPEYVLLGGLKGRDDLGHKNNTKELTAARQERLPEGKPQLAGFKAGRGSQGDWVKTQSRFYNINPTDTKGIPQDVIDKFKQRYGEDWGIKKAWDWDIFNKTIWPDDELPTWWNIVKLAKPNRATITDNQWLSLKDKILNDEVPVDRNKYVKYSNLSKINKEMVLYYLRLGFTKPQRRREAYNGILDEMLRSSNERYDIQDKGGQ